MSYEKVQINGKDYGLKFNQMSLEIYQSKFDKNAPQSTAIYAIIWAGLKSNAYRKNNELELSFEQVCDFIDATLENDTNSEILTKIIKTFESSTAVRSAIDNAEKKNTPEPTTLVSVENSPLAD